MALITKHAASSGFVRRFYTSEPIPFTTNNIYRAIDAFPIVKTDSFVIIPYVTGNDADLQVQVSYDEPQYASGEFEQDDDDNTADGDGTFTWRPYITDHTVTSDDTGDSRKIVISQFNTGITAVRISAKSTVDGSSSDLSIYVRGYHIQR